MHTPRGVEVLQKHWAEALQKHLMVPGRREDSNSGPLGDTLGDESFKLRRPLEMGRPSVPGVSFRR